MGYLRKGTVINALRDDRETTLACYEGERERDIIRFCYDCMERELDSLQQYEPESVVEQPKIYDVDKIVDQLEKEKEYANADFEEYAKHPPDKKAVQSMKRKPYQNIDVLGYLQKKVQDWRGYRWSR